MQGLPEMINFGQETGNYWNEKEGLILEILHDRSSYHVIEVKLQYIL
jgi:hypothetical protein